MKNDIFVFENESGQTVRTVHFESSQLNVIFLHENKKIDFVSSTHNLDAGGVVYSILAKTNKAQLRQAPLKITQVGTLKSATSLSDPAPEVSLPPEDENIFPLLLKRSTILHLVIVVLFLLGAWIYNRFIYNQEDPVTVAVIRQDRQSNDIQKFVNISKTKIAKNNNKSKVSNKKIVAKSRSYKKNNQRKVVTRPGTSLHNMGPLSVLGGMASGKKSASGLNVSAKASGAGIGYGGSAAKGGSSRGTFGKGLVQSGIGNGESVQGYGGYGTKGKGGGQPGYGASKIGGSSGAYFEPLGEESLVEGGLDQDQINAVIQRNLGQVIYCYEQGLQAKPNLSGRVAVKFVISATGSVRTANVLSTSLGSNQIESCIVAKLKNWQFPKPVGQVNVRVTYPFVLKRLSSKWASSAGQ